MLGPTRVTLAPSLSQAKNVRARHAAEKNVADDRDVKPGNFSALLTNRVKVEQRLGGMFVRAVAGIDHARFQAAGQKLRRAGRTVAQNEDVRVKASRFLRGVFERFAFRQARSGRGDVDHVRAQPKRGEFKRCARARARFDEEIDQRFAAQAPGLS